MSSRLHLQTCQRQHPHRASPAGRHAGSRAMDTCCGAPGAEGLAVGLLVRGLPPQGLSLPTRGDLPLSAMGGAVTKTCGDTCRTEHLRVRRALPSWTGGPAEGARRRACSHGAAHQCTPHAAQSCACAPPPPPPTLIGQGNQHSRQQRQHQRGCGADAEPAWPAVAAQRHRAGAPTREAAGEMLCRCAWWPRLCSSMGSCRKSLSMKCATRHSRAIACARMRGTLSSWGHCTAQGMPSLDCRAREPLAVCMCVCDSQDPV